MVPSFVSLCAQRLVSDHSLSPRWLGCVPRELYCPLLEAALLQRRPLAIGELVQRWPERTLCLGRGLLPSSGQGQGLYSRLCVQALLLAVVKGLGDPRCALRVLDLCGVQCERGAGDTPESDSMGGWSLTLALCSAVLQARGSEAVGVAGTKLRRGGSLGEGEWKRGLARGLEGEMGGEGKRERGLGVGAEGEKEKGALRHPETGRERKRGYTRLMEMDSEREHATAVDVRADLFVNSRSWERVRAALTAGGPLRLQCRELRVEAMPATSIVTMLSLLPRPGLQGLDLRYSNLGVDGLALLIPALAPFPELRSLRLHYCNLDLRRHQPGQEVELCKIARGLGALGSLRRLSMTALRLSGHLRLLLSSLSQPLEVLELPYFSLTPADLSYLSCSPHVSSLQRLDLSENRLGEEALPSLCRLLHQASGSLLHLSLCGCGLTDGQLEMLRPCLTRCQALRTLGLALNPLSQAGVFSLVRVATAISSLQLLLYPQPLESYQPGLPHTPSSYQLMEWPLEEEDGVLGATQAELERCLQERGRTDLLVTSDLLTYSSIDNPE
ncbi:leucine-rich repeat-containing protein 14 [Lepisosteus oculatus]